MADSKKSRGIIYRRQSYAADLRQLAMFDKTLEYIHQNPIQAGFLTRTEDWKYSSAKDFCLMKGVVELSYS